MNKTTAVIAIAAALLLATGCHKLPRGSVAYGPHGVIASAPSLPASRLQEISYQGVQVDVPRGWRLLSGRCGHSTANTVAVFEFFVCGLPLVVPTPDYSKYTEVNVSPLDGFSTQLQALTVTSTVHLDGTRVRRGVSDRPVDGDKRPIYVLEIPSRNVLVTVQTLNTRLANQILTSVRFEMTDRHGCAAHILTWHPSRAHGVPAGANKHLVPGTPTAGSICTYEGDGLVRSIAIPHDQLANNVAVLDKLKPGMSRAGSNMGEDCQAGPHEGSVMRFTYANNAVLQVWVHVAGCIGFSATNGQLRSQISADLSQVLFDDGIYKHVADNRSVLRPMNAQELRQYLPQQP